MAPRSEVFVSMPRGQYLHFLKKTYLDEETLSLLYKFLVDPRMEYAI